MLRVAKWVGLPILIACTSEDGTDVTDMLNSLIARSTGDDVYTGGTGIIVRAPDFISGDGTKVVPASFWSNDITAPSQFYPSSGNIWFPMADNHWDGYFDQSQMTPDEPGGADGPWSFASVGIVVGSSMEQLYPEDFGNIQSYDWGWGVFYATDSNSVDQRCRWRDDVNGYDCPGGWMDSNGYFKTDNHKGAGDYLFGNPDAYGDQSHGGGAGCHIQGHTIDQPDTADQHNNLVKDAHCQCNDGLKNNNWHDWFEVFSTQLKQKSGFEHRAWLTGNGNLAPSWAADGTMCWVSNPRDLIMMQNEMHWNRQSWNNQMIPKTDWSTGQTSELRKYWGWNEIPVSRDVAEDPINWDSIMIKLPADVCNNDFGSSDSVWCLGPREQEDLEKQIDQFVNQNKLLLGFGNIATRPGSYVVFAREWGQAWGSSMEGNLGSSFAGVNWQRWFFCENWNSPSGKYQIVHTKPSDDPNGNGACYIDWGGTPTPGPTPSPTPGPTPSPSPWPVWRKDDIVHTHSQKCLGVGNGNFYNGNPIIVSACDGSDTQGWQFDSMSGTLVTSADTGMCVDAPGTWEGTYLQLWECNGQPQQWFGFGDDGQGFGAGTIYASDSSDATLCMDVQHSGDWDENLVWLWGCNGIEDNQSFQPLSSTNLFA